MSKPRISICVPIHQIPETPAFLERLHASIERQSFKDYEIVITEEGRMAENSNAAIKKATGEIVKVLYMDDYLFSDKALEHIDQAFADGAKWAVSGCIHDDGMQISGPHMPHWNVNIRRGVNTIGSPSVLAFVNDDPLLFDERMSWLLDVELYSRLYERYGEPTIIPEIDVAIGIGPHQTTYKLSDDDKRKEHLL